jgi:hypothetical protein
MCEFDFRQAQVGLGDRPIAFAQVRRALFRIPFPEMNASVRQHLNQRIHEVVVSGCKHVECLRKQSYLFVSLHQGNEDDQTSMNIELSALTGRADYGAATALSAPSVQTVRILEMRPKGRQAARPQRDIPLPGPHARPELVDPEKTPGTGTLTRSLETRDDW